MSKALNIVGISVLVIGIAGVVAWGGYALANWQNEQVKNASDNTNNSGGSAATVPTKPTVDTTCNTDELSVAAKVADAPGAGKLAINIVFTNSGSRTCKLFGYPGVSLVNDNGNQIGQPASRQNGVEEKTLNLTPGATAQATVTYVEEGNFDPGTCSDGATKIRVYPPNDVGYISVTEDAVTSWCPGFMTSPVQ